MPLLDGRQDRPEIFFGKGGYLLLIDCGSVQSLKECLILGGLVIEEGDSLFHEGNGIGLLIYNFKSSIIILKLIIYIWHLKSVEIQS